VLKRAKEDSDADPECQRPNQIKYFTQEQYSRMDIEQRSRLLSEYGTYVVKVESNYLGPDENPQDWLPKTLYECDNQAYYAALRRTRIDFNVPHQVSGKLLTI
jgi:hypothetical protein